MHGRIQRRCAAISSQDEVVFAHVEPSVTDGEYSPEGALTANTDGASPKNDRISETLTASHSSSQQLTAQN